MSGDANPKRSNKTQLKVATQRVPAITGLPDYQISVNSKYLIIVSKEIISLSARPHAVNVISNIV